MEVKSKYPACDHLKKQPQLPINKELRDELTKNFRVLPIYEKAIADHKFSKIHSLHNNEFLHCRWQEYQRIHISVKPDPFIFPHVNDFHFYNYDTCYKPDQSIMARPNNRLWLKDGPGVDKYGEIPVPSDVGFRKTGLMVDRNKIIVKPKPKTKKKIKRIKPVKLLL